MEQFTVQLNNATCTVCIGAGVLGCAGALLRQEDTEERQIGLLDDMGGNA